MAWASTVLTARPKGGKPKFQNKWLSDPLNQYTTQTGERATWLGRAFYSVGDTDVHKVVAMFCEVCEKFAVGKGRRGKWVRKGETDSGTEELPDGSEGGSLLLGDRCTGGRRH